MPGNAFGKLFVVTTFGESHGPAYGCVVDGCPPGLALSEADIQQELDRRRPGQSRYTSQRREKDSVRILSGVFEGYTTGTPIGLLIENNDARSSDYEELRPIFRPGHADFTYQHKYGRRDHRGGGRASARETMMRVAAGAIAKKYLKEQAQLTITGYLAQIGSLLFEAKNLAAVNDTPFFCPDPERVPELEEYFAELRRQCDSIGARVNVIAHNVPIGLGEPVFDGLDADIAKGMMSINAVKGVEIGTGFESIMQLGSTYRDPITPQGFASNHSGGTLGGISTGQPILVSVAFKPTSSIAKPISSVNENNQPINVSVKGRHDPCVGLRAVPIVEAMLALVLMDHLLRDRAQNFNSKNLL